MRTFRLPAWLHRALVESQRLPLCGPLLHRVSITARLAWTRAAAGWIARRYLRHHSSPRLHLGAGGDAPAGWLNTDLFPSSWHMPRLDATGPLPFADGTFDFVFTEHMIEHVSIDAARHLLRECHRVIHPGGRLRVATPDARQLARLLLEPAAPDVRRYLAWSAQRLGRPDDDTLPAHAVDHLYRSHGHRFLYDEAALRSAFAAAGFTDIRRHSPGESDHPELRGLELHHLAIGDDANRFETLILEARRA